MTKSSELSKALQEIIFLKRSLENCKICIRSTEEAINSHLELGCTVGVAENIELKKRMMREIGRVTNSLVEAKKNFDLWKAIEEIQTAATR
ncbi:hypothetical protein LCGC14_0810250 [marine sediment metagenome]|uniref:Uncharacterized protein n=1 Tax=marine sediment metagenome TaxID=412755 RepID=A0A0F9S711_9ZZZZ